MKQHPAYELFEELGRGANTVVYRSYDLSLGREVAIKELQDSARQDSRHRERFLREAQFLAQFEHDNVLRVYSVDTERGWIVMELMKGTLASLAAAGPSDPDLVRSILKQTLEALAFLHEKNKVHGTVRPTNLLINEYGRVKLSEFEQTATGGELRAPTGSKKYLAPELIRPEFGDFGPPLDLYCLGFTALELLKGPQFESLFPGTGKGAIDADVAWLRWHSSPDELPSTRKLIKNIPDDLAQVLDHMLKKRVADRPQSAQEVLKELADRPLVPVPVAGGEPEALAPGENNPFSPAVVRTLATPQQMVLPGGNNPTVAGGAPATAAFGSTAAKTARTAKSATKAGKPAAPRYSKEWWNQQLGRPYVLYPLCAAILLVALWFTYRTVVGPAKPTVIPVTFDVKPDAAGLKVVVNKKTIPLHKSGVYPFLPGRHKVTFNKPDFEPLTREFEVSPEQNRFAVELKPVIKFVDVVVQVTPADAQLKVGEAATPVANGSYTHKHQLGQPLKLEATRDGYVTASNSFTADDLAKLNHKVTITLEKERPKLPAALAAKPGAGLDPETQLPVRAVAAKLTGSEALEFVLVRPGAYNFGSAEKERRDGELPQRSVQIEQPYYIAVHETTNDHYGQFSVAEGKSAAGDRWQRASAKWAAALSLDPEKNKLPVTNVSPDEAAAFCRWLGGRLPTEIEWESAVRGPQDKGYPQPWGSAEATPERCRIFDADPKHELGPVAVDTLADGASPLGLMHAVGNAAEWCSDSETPTAFILRGCSFATANINDVRVTWRHKGDTQGEEDTGFRVVIPITDVIIPPATSQATTATTPAAPITTPAPMTTSAASTDSAPTGIFAPLQVLHFVLSNHFGR